MTNSIDESTTFAPHDRSSVLSEKIRLRLSELIRHRELAGGQVITEERLAETLGVSRTPLREALLRLEGEGMLEKNSGRSYMVRRVDFQEYMQSLKMRRIIEPEAAALAAPRTPQAELEDVRAQIRDLHIGEGKHTEAHWDSDDRLHRLFGYHSGNLVMFEIIERLRVTTRLFESTDIRQRVEADYQEHMEILEALSAKDPERARRAVDAHIDGLITYSLEQLT